MHNGSNKERAHELPEVFEELRKQIHEIRNFCGPFDLKLSVNEQQIAEHRRLVNQRLENAESRMFATLLVLDDLVERVSWIESVLRIPPRPEHTPLPVREDKEKESPPTPPSQKPGP